MKVARLRDLAADETPKGEIDLRDAPATVIPAP
jgi:hypothetical protein